MSAYEGAVATALLWAVSREGILAVRAAETAFGAGSFRDRDQ